MGLGVGGAISWRPGTGTGWPWPGAARVRAASKSSWMVGEMRSENRVVPPSTSRRPTPKVSEASTSSMRPSSMPRAAARRFSTKASA